MARGILFLSPLVLISVLLFLPSCLPVKESIPTLEPTTRYRFSSGECFQHNGIREPWETSLPDGIVIMRGYEKYLVMFTDQAEATGGGDKYGTEISLETMETQFHSIACPKAWKEHTHEEGKNKEARNHIWRSYGNS